MAKRSYSAKERKAYHMGRAYAAAKAGKRVNCPDSKSKQSFRNGVNSVRGKAAGKKKTSGKGDMCLVVDGNGVVVGKLKC